jgi:hypothetical protein
MNKRRPRPRGVSLSTATRQKVTQSYLADIGGARRANLLLSRELAGFRIDDPLAVPRPISPAPGNDLLTSSQSAFDLPCTTPPPLPCPPLVPNNMKTNEIIWFLGYLHTFFKRKLLKITQSSSLQKCIAASLLYFSTQFTLVVFMEQEKLLHEKIRDL